MVFGKAYTLVPSYFARELAVPSAPAIHLPFALLGTVGAFAAGAGFGPPIVAGLRAGLRLPICDRRLASDRLTLTPLILDGGVRRSRTASMTARRGFRTERTTGTVESTRDPVRTPSFISDGTDADRSVERAANDP